MALKKLIGKGRLPKKENLAKLSPEQLKNVLHRFGINAIEIRDQMLREIGTIGGQVTSLNRQGIAIDDARRTQLKSQSKRIRTSLERRMTGKAINEFHLERLKVDFEDELSKRIWVWITKFKRSCDSCIPRHNQVKSYNEWERVGLPKSDALICDGNCNCDLVPRPDIEGKKIAKNPKDLGELRTRKRTKKEVKEVKIAIQKGLFKDKLIEKLKKTLNIDEKRILIVNNVLEGKISGNEAERLIKKFIK